MTKNIFIGVLATLVYYISIYFIIAYAFDVFPSSGGPSEAFFILLAFALLSIIIFLYNFLKFMKGDISKFGLILTHLISMNVLCRLLT